MISVAFSQQQMEYFLLVLVRISAFFVVVPFFNDNNVPVRIKVILSVFVSYLVYSLMPKDVVLEYQNVYEFAALIFKESAVGLLLGYSAFICSMIIQFSGRVIDMEIGLAMMQMFDPSTRTQSGVTGMFYHYMIMMLLIASNMHIYLLNAIVDSFQLVPIGQMKINLSMYSIVVQFLSDYFIIGFRIVLPIFAVTLILNCILGIMAKVSPQMNMFAVGMQLKVLAGLFVLFVTVSLLPVISSMIFTEMKEMVANMMRGMT